MNQPGFQILVIDHRPIIREGVVVVLSAALEGMAIAGSGCFSEAMDRIGNQPIDLVVTDFRVKGDTALSFLKELERTNSRTRCLMLSDLDEIQVGYPCIRAGASGFVGKSSSVAVVVDAARSILAGRHYLSERLSKALMAGGLDGWASSAGTHLTTRELQIFSLIGAGLSVSAIALKLGVSVKTVEAHRENIKNKLGYQNASELAAAAVRWLDDTSVTI